MNNLILEVSLILIAILLQYLFLKYRLKIGNYFGLIDIPNKHKIHKNPTPLVGSFSSVFFFLIANAFIAYQNFDKDLILLLLISLAFFFIGLIDDRYNLMAYKKFFLTIIILFISLFFSEKLIVTQLYSSFLDRYYNLEKLSIFFTILCILLLTNALNLADGINGLASGIATIWMFLITFYTINHYSYIYFLISILMLVNTYFIYRGKFFLGDSGSLFFGSAISLLLIFNYNETMHQRVIPLETVFIFFMIPGIDMFRLFLFRIVRKRNPFARDLSHLHHYLLKIFRLPKVLIIYFSLILLSIFLNYFFSGISLYIICIYTLIYGAFIFYIKNKKYL